MRKLTVLAVLVMLCGAIVFAQSLPSSKETAQINGTVVCKMTATETPDMEMTLPAKCSDLYTGAAVDTEGAWIEIMRKPMKVSSSQSLFVSTSLVTGLYTSTTTKTRTPTEVGDTLNTSTAKAMGGVYLRAEVQDAAGKVVAVGSPLNLCSASGPYGCVDPKGTDDWGVILNSRIQTLTQSLSNCVVNVVVGGVAGTGTCDFTSTIELILDTTSAHSFNFIFENLGATSGSGVYNIVVKAAVASDASIVEGSGAAIGAAVFGLGSMTVEKVRLVHDFEF